MVEEPHALLGPWESFYVIVGSSGGALTGLQFVVLALGADRRVKATSREIDAFGTPTIVHFCAALLIAVLMSAPWPSVTGVTIGLAVTGLFGLGYSGIVFRRAQRQTGYEPVAEDWIWHAVLPAVAYGAIAAGAFLLHSHTVLGLFLVGAASVLLLFIGIHNSWDSVSYIATKWPPDE